MDQIKNALRLSPRAKKQKPDSEAPIFDVISKIPNADTRELLSKFFSGDFPKPTNCSANLWSLVSAFGDVLCELSSHTCETQKEINVEESAHMDTTSTDGWSTTVNRARKRHKTTTLDSRTSNSQIDALKEAERLRSVVVCHFAESEKSDVLAAEQDDDVAIRQMIHKISPSAKVEKLYRMGKVNPNRQRLVKVVLCTSSMQRSVLLNAKSLKNHVEYKRVFVRKSMTPSELDESNKKRAELRWLRQLDSRWVLYRDVFWIRDEISSGVRATTPPPIPNDCHTNVTAGRNSQLNNQAQEN